MSPTQKTIPDIELDIPQDWTWHQRDRSPLALMPVSGEGALQISTPRTGRSWRDYHDPDALVRQFVAGARLGDVLHVEIGEIPYGRFVSAACMDERSGDICVWLIIPQTHDPLFITWIAQTPTEAGHIARRLIGSIRGGPFSAAVATAVTVVQNDLAAGRSTTPLTCLYCFQPREIVAVDLSFCDEDRLIVEAIRHERARLNASVVTRTGLAERRLPDRPPERLAFVYAESSSRRKRFLLPFSDEGRTVHEVEADGHPISGFFAPPDERVARALDAARRES